MELIIIGMAALAVVLIVLSRLMAAQNTGVSVNTAKIYQGGGDPAVLWYVAEGTITPGDNVEPGSVAASEVKRCDNSAEEFTGTADLNKKGGALAGTDPVSTDYATGDLIGVITGACHVLKTAEGTIVPGYMLRPGTTAGRYALEQASTIRYTIGRAITYATDGNTFVMKQF